MGDTSGTEDGEATAFELTRDTLADTKGVLDDICEPDAFDNAVIWSSKPVDFLGDVAEIGKRLDSTIEGMIVEEAEPGEREEAFAIRK